MFRTALRNVLSHKARLLMTVLAVLLGVAFVSGTLVFTDTLGHAFRNQSAKSYDNVAVAVTSYSDSSNAKEAPGVSTRTLDHIRGLDGVASATGRISGFAGVADRDGKLIGNGWSNKGGNFSPGAQGKDSRYAFADGSGPARAGQIALDRDTADKGGYHVGDTVRVATNGPVRTYTLAGIFTTDDGAVGAGGSLVLFDTAAAQKLYLQPGWYEDVDIAAAPGVSEAKIRSEVEPLLPDNATAKTGGQLADEQAKQIEREMSGLNQMLLGFAAVALFVGIFLISNTFTMLVAQRTKELALLRAVGASRKQVTRSVLAEALVVGTVASVVGFVLGIGLAVGLRSAMGSFGAKVPGGPLIVAPTTALAALLVGVLITMLAAWLPARRAARIPPVAAMGSAHLPATTKSLVVRNSIGAVITLIGAAVIMAGASSGSGGRMMIGAGAFLALVGVIVLIPLLSRPVIALVRPLLTRVFGVSGKLAGQNAVRNPRRTGATASALAIGLTLVTGLTVIGVTVGQSVDRMTTDNFKGDYMVEMANGMSLAPSTVSALEKAKGVTALSPQSGSQIVIDGSDQSVSGVKPGGIQQVLTLPVVSGSLDSLARGEIAVEQKTADKHGWKPGSKVSAKYLDDKKGSLTVGAVFKENQFVSSVLAPTSVLAPHEKTPDIQQIFVKTGGSGSGEQALVDAMGGNPAISVLNQQDIRNAMGGMINTILNIMYGLLAMALIIAVLGVINTLAMSVFERQQEIGMLRAIGLDRAKVKRMIRLEAVVISLFGAVVGIALGTFLAWAVGQTIKSSIPHYVLVMPWGRIGVFLVLAAIVGVLAALWPARNAARLNMLTAIKTE
ncbi:ABC transporter permease [Streptomyces sp. NBC_00859]|uniref:ABC transporter permease n=1 Tax=Streptomyces sp. NBC_00859 TaxID=2903682 RepID=UPI0038696B64|nr:FtsX-like permease family protein [Streptomyces sp. NBC_00859]